MGTTLFPSDVGWQWARLHIAQTGLAVASISPRAGYLGSSMNMPKAPSKPGYFASRLRGFMDGESDAGSEQLQYASRNNYGLVSPLPERDHMDQDSDTDMLGHRHPDKEATPGVESRMPSAKAESASSASRDGMDSSHRVVRDTDHHSKPNFLKDGERSSDWKPMASLRHPVARHPISRGIFSERLQGYQAVFGHIPTELTDEDVEMVHSNMNKDCKGYKLLKINYSRLFIS